MIFCAPRHGKSELVSVRFPAWYLGRNPDRRMIGVSYAQGLADRFSGQAKNQFDDPRWPYQSVTLATDTHSKRAWDIAGHYGGYISAGVGAGITGFGGDLILIDDPLRNREAADSPVQREALWDWYTSTLYTRLEDDGAVILIQTRWHESDLAGRLLAQQTEGGDQWEVISLPAIADTELHPDDPRAPGEALWPDKYDVTALNQIRSAVGSRDWEALYQQRPLPPDGAMFQRQWFEVIDEAPEGLHWVRYWDLAASTKTTADYTAAAAVAIDGDGNIYIRDMIRGRWEWPDARRIIKQTMLDEPKARHHIEQALHGLAALQDLRRDPDLVNIAIAGVRVDKDKVSRALPWAARAEAGKVRLVRGPWINDFLLEVCAFPLGTHDDQVDTVSGGVQALSRQRFRVV